MAATARLVALLRAVNVGGRSLLMTDLKAALHRLGYVDVQTLLQSGNAVILAKGRERPDQIERRLERDLVKSVALESAVFVRTRLEWDEIVASNPFPHEAKTDPARLILMLLKTTPSPDAVKRLQAAIKGPEIVHAAGRRLDVLYPDGMGRSKLTNALIERTLATTGTARNWNTVLKLAVMVST
jgi:uncharacterized protein (DUF1697 family)